MEALTTRHIALLAVLCALCLGIQLAPRPSPNVESTSLIVFVVGAIFGIVLGSLLGTVVMVINGFLSPWGFAGLIMPFQIVGMVIVGVMGGLYGRTRNNVYTSSSCAEAAVLGAFVTLVYDIITNFGVAVSLMLAGTPLLPAFIGALVLGALFSLIHVVSNFLIFLLAFFPLARSLQEFLGGENAWRKSLPPT